MVVISADDLVKSIIRSRHGSVLGTKTILKKDHFNSGIIQESSCTIFGAPNFRAAELNIYGVAQPTFVGLLTILKHLSTYTEKGFTTLTWISTREEPIIYINDVPFVLREEDSPFMNIAAYTGINSIHLEQMEERLADDIIKEAKLNGGNIVVHDEKEPGKLMPYLMAVNRVRTSKAVFNDFSHFNIDYHRVPLSASRSLYENFADSVFCIVKETSLEAPLIFSCGMGLGRTSHSMILGMLTRRWMCLQKGFPDPFGSEEVKNCVIANPMIHSTLDADRRYLLQIIHLLQKGLDGIQPPEFSVEWAFKNSGSLGGLISAIKGEYHVIYQLLSVLLHPELKHIVDVAINRCSHLLNVREHILSSYIKYAASKDYKALVNASIFLQRYFSLICFGGFLTMENCKFQSFSTWFKSRNELWSMFQRIQKNSEDNCLFLPMDSLKSLVGNDLSGDLTSLDSTSLRDFVSDTETLAVINGRNGTVLGPNMILKLDHWLRKEKLNSGPQNGEILMFRKMNYFNASVHIYGMSQPTCEGILNLKEYMETADSENMVIWINLREEPVVYLNGEPYVLRDRYHTLRNTKSFKGIHVDQLEALENRLVTDIKLEALMFKNSLLVHEEEEGRIKPAWLQLKDLDLNILSVKQCIPSTIQYHRVPVTAEDSPEFSDFDEICSILMNAFQQWGSTSKFSVAVNCQVGTGRSSIGMIVCAMVLNCLLIINQESIQAPVDYDGAVPSSEFSYCTVFQKNEYSIIKALVRIVDNGTRAKLLTDRLIAAAGGEDLRETISKYRHLAEETLDKREQLRYVRKGLIYLKRYFLLVAFQAYLLRLEQELPSERSSLKAVSPALAIEGLTNEIHLSSHERLLAEHFDKPSFGITFETWMNGHPEFIHMMQNFFEDNPKISTIIPETVNLDLLLPDIGRKDSKGEMGRPAQAEVLRILSSQSGSALQVNAILKEDHFPGCQSSRLIDDIVKGGPNFRRLPIIFLENRGFDFSKLPVNSSNAEFSPSIVFATQKEEEIGYGLLGKKYIAGVAIPTLDAIESILWKMDATEECGTRQVVWTSLREEPVIYINRRPYVLRSIDSPYSNFEATGISRERVEDVEIRMKSDILAQAQKYNGRILLHGEMPLDGRFVLSPYMEDVSQSEILTPREYYERLVIEGFGIQYHRLPITDEQSPIPLIFDELVEIYWKLGSNQDAIFNCQMGRGRTTTGMIIATLIQIIAHRGLLSIAKPPSMLQADSDVETHLKNGNYNLIAKLVRLLEYGNLAKKLTDICIDYCDHMQNLRTAIYDFKFQLESSQFEDRDSKEYREHFRRGLNYLIRYFYLIVFTNFLLNLARQYNSVEILDSMERTPLKFSEWLQSRKEILKLASDPKIDFS